MQFPLKMPGSKRRTFAQILPRLPAPREGRGFVLPFFGTGADAYQLTQAGFRLEGLGDANPHLCHLYRMLRERGPATLAAVAEVAASFPAASQADAVDAQRAWFGERRTWYNARYHALGAAFDNTLAAGDEEAAAVFVCVWRASFNGLVRCHRTTGCLNAPPGITHKTGPKTSLIDLPALGEYAAWLRAIPPVHCIDYEATLAELCRWGDIPYLDPPYLGTFDGFSGPRFDTDRLVRVLQTRPARSRWAMSNAPHDRWPRDFPDASVYGVNRAGTVAASAAARAQAHEVVIVRH